MNLVSKKFINHLKTYWHTLLKRKTTSSDTLKFSSFLSPEALYINKARLEHLRSLDLDHLLKGKNVLEVGAGIGLLTEYFEKLGCMVVSTDAREENINQIRKTFPQRKTAILDLNEVDAVENLKKQWGDFDIVFCYGTLYHLSEPDLALQNLSAICTGLILLETCVTPGNHVDIHRVRENATLNQAANLIGCRPTRPWIMGKLKQYWGQAYISELQPQHDEFETNWLLPYKSGNHRAVFIGAKKPIESSHLLNYLPDIQKKWTEH